MQQDYGDSKNYATVPSLKENFKHLSLGPRLGGTDSKYRQRKETLSKGFLTAQTPNLHVRGRYLELHWLP